MQDPGSGRFKCTKMLLSEMKQRNQFLHFLGLRLEQAAQKSADLGPGEGHECHAHTSCIIPVELQRRDARWAANQTSGKAS